MHIGLLVSVAPSPLAETIPEHLEPLERLVEIVERRRCPVSIHLGGPLCEVLRTDRSDLAARLRELEVEWIRAGWGEPSFATIPPEAAARHIEAETDALDELGLHPGGLVVRGAWDSSLVSTFGRHGIPYLIINAAHYSRPEVGVVDRFDSVLPVIPLMGTLPDLPTANADDLLMVEVTSDQLEDMLTPARCGGLTTPGAFLADHPMRRRPMLTQDGWRHRIAGDPETEILYRKMVRLVTRVPDRLPAATTRTVLAAQYGPAYTPGAHPGARREAHRALIRARRAIDGVRHRGDGWVRLSRLDWDADGAEEVQIELPELSAVVAPQTATVLYVDDKTRTWPVSAVEGEDGGVWRLFHGEDLDAIGFELVGVEEHRGAATVDLRTPEGSVELRIEAEGRVIRLVTTIGQRHGGRAGPELKLAFEDEVRVRVDGSPWGPVSAPVIRAGHRFRFEDDERQVVVAAMTPVDCAMRPAAAGGVVVWPSWPISGPATYELAIELV